MTTFRTLGSVTAAVAVIVVALSLWGAAWVWLMLFGAVLLAIAVRAGAEPIAEHTPLGPTASVTVVVLGAIGLCAGVGVGMAPTLSDQIGRLGEELPRRLDEVESELRESPLVQRLGLMPPEQPQGAEAAPTPAEAAPTPTQPRRSGGRAPSMLSTAASPGQVVSGLAHAASTLVTAIGAALLVLASGLYLAFEPDVYVDGAVGLVPPAHRERARFVLGELGASLRRWLLGQFVSMTVVGVLMTIGLSALGVPLALVLGLLSGLLDFVPNFGPILALAPALLLADEPLYVLALWAVVQTLEAYVITPLVQRQAVHMPPVLLIGAQVVLSVLLGAAGLVTAAPLIVVGMVLVKRLYKEDVLGDVVESWPGAAGREPGG